MDLWLRQVDPNLSRRHAQQLCNAKLVLQNGLPVKKSDLVIPGATVLILDPLTDAARAAPDVPLQILRATADHIVVNKPAGLPCAALRGRTSATLAGALLARFPELDGVGHGPRDPGLIHRLDTQTSGLVVVARNQTSFVAMTAALTGKTWDKRYLALVPAARLKDTGDCEAKLAPDPNHRRRVIVDERRGRVCHSSYTVLRRGARIDLVEVQAKSAYRHQVRAHLASLGAPLIGDTLYGGLDWGLAPRHALHASYIDMPIPGFAPIACPLAPDLRSILDLD